MTKRDVPTDCGLSPGWPDPLKDEIATNLRNRFNLTGDLTDIYDLFDRMERELKLHREARMEVMERATRSDGLAEALRPFAEASRRFDAAALSFGTIISDDTCKPKTDFTHGQLRAAARALTAHEQGKAGVVPNDPPSGDTQTGLPVTDETEASDPTQMLLRDHARMRKAGTDLAEAAVRVVNHYDGLHRLSLAVSAWMTAIANEGDRPHDR